MTVVWGDASLTWQDVLRDSWLSWSSGSVMLHSAPSPVLMP
jgi:hypothetical protein